MNNIGKGDLMIMIPFLLMSLTKSELIFLPGDSPATQAYAITSFNIHPWFTA